MTGATLIAFIWGAYMTLMNYLSSKESREAVEKCRAAELDLNFARKDFIEILERHVVLLNKKHDEETNEAKKIELYCHLHDTKEALKYHERLVEKFND